MLAAEHRPSKLQGPLRELYSLGMPPWSRHIYERGYLLRPKSGDALRLDIALIVRIPPLSAIEHSSAAELPYSALLGHALMPKYRDASRLDWTSKAIPPTPIAPEP